MKQTPFFILLLPLFLMFMGCGQIEEPRNLKLSVTTEIKKKLDINLKKLASEYNIPNTELNELNKAIPKGLGENGKLRLEKEIDFSTLSSSDQKKQIELLRLELRKNPDGSGKDIPIRNKVKGSVDLTLLQGISIEATGNMEAGGNTELATIKKGTGTKDEIFLEVKSENILRLLDSDKKLKIAFVIDTKTAPPHLKDLDVEAQITTLIEIANSTGISLDR